MAVIGSISGADEKASESSASVRLSLKGQLFLPTDSLVYTVESEGTTCA